MGGGREVQVTGRSSVPWARVVPLFPSAPHTTPASGRLLMGVERNLFYPVPAKLLISWAITTEYGIGK